jgi:hypothetical protein
VELEGRLEKVLAVVKMRTSQHDTSIHRYAIGSSGVVVGETVKGYGGVLTGLPLVRFEDGAPPLGLTRDEAALLQALRELGEVDASALTRRTGLQGSALALALERLRHLAYASVRRRQEVPVYRAKPATK